MIDTPTKYMAAGMVVCAILVIACKAQRDASLQKNEILLAVACARPQAFAQTLHAMKIPNGKYSGPIKNNPAAWDLIKEKMLGACKKGNLS